MNMIFFWKVKLVRQNFLLYENTRMWCFFHGVTPNHLSVRRGAPPPAAGVSSGSSLRGPLRFDAPQKLAPTACVRRWWAHKGRPQDPLLPPLTTTFHFPAPESCSATLFHILVGGRPTKMCVHFPTRLGNMIYVLPWRVHWDVRGAARLAMLLGPPALQVTTTNLSGTRRGPWAPWSLAVLTLRGSSATPQLAAAECIDSCKRHHRCLHA